MAAHIGVEVIATSVRDALAAEAGGADRLELVSDLEAGGTTPDPDLVRRVKAAVGIPVYVMIRPRSGGFVYTASEVETMVQQARRARKEGADGLVVGALDPGGGIDVGTVAQVVEAAGLPFTFHRAFDESADLSKAFASLAGLPGLERLLTSGGPGNAFENRAIVADLVERGRRMARPVRVMPGAGVTAENVQALLRGTGAVEVHLGRAVRLPAAPWGQVQEELVRRIRALVDAL